MHIRIHWQRLGVKDYYDVLVSSAVEADKRVQDLKSEPNVSYAYWVELPKITR